jgi:hypothetical protein
LEIELKTQSSGQADGPTGILVENWPMAGLGNNLVQVFRTLRVKHWVEFTFWAGFELSSSWSNLPCYGVNRKRNILVFMRWHLEKGAAPCIDLGAQDLNGFNGQNIFQK